MDKDFAKTIMDASVFNLDLVVAQYKEENAQLKLMFEMVEQKINETENNYLKNIDAIEIKLKEAEEILKQLKLSLGKID